MLISGALGGSNQFVTAANNADKGKTEATNSGLSFLGVAKEVGEILSGKIVVAGGSSVKTPDFLKERFDYAGRAPEGADSVYDFISEIEKILKDAKQK